AWSDVELYPGRHGGSHDGSAISRTGRHRELAGPDRDHLQRGGPGGQRCGPAHQRPAGDQCHRPSRVALSLPVSHASGRAGAGDGEFVGLFTPDSPRKLASGFAPSFPVQRNDYSYGRDPNGNLRYFATPTPGASNGFSLVTGVVDPVHFSTPRGHYSQPFTLA